MRLYIVISPVQDISIICFMYRSECWMAHMLSICGQKLDAIGLFFAKSMLI